MSTLLKKIIPALFHAFILMACSSPHAVLLHCTDATLDIYVNGEYIGRGACRYVFPAGQTTIEVTCNENGQELYRRTIFKDACSPNEVLDIVPQRSLNYSH